MAHNEQMDNYKAHRINYEANSWIYNFIKQTGTLIDYTSLISIIENNTNEGDMFVLIFRYIFKDNRFTRTVHSKTKNFYAMFYIYLFYGHIILNYTNDDSRVFFRSTFLNTYKSYATLLYELYETPSGKQKKQSDRMNLLKKHYNEMLDSYREHLGLDKRNQNVEKLQKKFMTMKNLLILLDDTYDKKKEKLNLLYRELEDNEFSNKISLIHTKIKNQETLNTDDKGVYGKYNTLKMMIFKLEKEVSGGKEIFERINSAKEQIINDEFNKNINLLSEYQKTFEKIKTDKTKNSKLVSDFNFNMKKLKTLVLDKPKFNDELMKKIKLKQDEIDYNFTEEVDFRHYNKNSPKPVNLYDEKMKAIMNVFNFNMKEAQEILNMYDYKEELGLSNYNYSSVLNKFFEVKKQYDSITNFLNFFNLREKKYFFSRSSLYKTHNSDEIILNYIKESETSNVYLSNPVPMFKYFDNYYYSFYFPIFKNKTLLDIFVSFVEMLGSNSKVLAEYSFDDRVFNLSNETFADYLVNKLNFNDNMLKDDIIFKQLSNISKEDTEDVFLNFDNTLLVSKNIVYNFTLQTLLDDYLSKINIEFIQYQNIILPNKDINTLIYDFIYKKVRSSLKNKINNKQFRKFDLIQTDIKPFLDYGYFFLYNNEIVNLVYDLELKQVMDVLRYENANDIMKDLQENKLKTYNITYELMLDKNKQLLLNKLTKYYDEYIFENFISDIRSDVKKMNLLGQYKKMFENMIYKLDYMDIHVIINDVFTNLLNFFKSLNIFINMMTDNTEQNTFNFLKNVLTYSITRKAETNDLVQIPENILFKHMFQNMDLKYSIYSNYNGLAVVMIFNLMVTDDDYKKKIYKELSKLAKPNEMMKNYNLSDITTWHKDIFSLIAQPSSTVVFKHLYNYIEINDFITEFKEIMSANPKIFKDTFNNYKVYNKFLIKTSDLLKNNFKLNTTVLNMLSLLEVVNIYAMLMSNIYENEENPNTLNFVFSSFDLINYLVKNKTVQKRKITYLSDKDADVFKKEEVELLFKKKDKKKGSLKKNVDELLNDFINKDYMVDLAKLSKDIIIDSDDIDINKNNGSYIDILDKKMKMYEKINKYRKTLEVHNHLFQETYERSEHVDALTKDVL